MPVEQIIVFVKAPRPGAVKTRLAKTLGRGAACDAYRRLVETLLQRLRDLRCVQVRFTPADAEPEIRPWVRPGWVALPQDEGDLGVRMQSAFAAAFRNGAQRVVIIGSDCPEVTAEDVAAAWHALLTHDLVLGPATDGGYWLIGLCRPQPALFHQMPWSTDQVFGQTLRRAAEAGLRVHRLRQLEDVDTPVAWQRFLDRFP
ncbi:MAG: TIGR04282 family arsenosugar biosynthesis glycosyltransferase [Verrucomicrobia bacterium]|nr:TIGR04282 family arsenosugar biosynthesis glycosyltransferase [Verrucomicrobiota bacterium]